MLIDDINKAIRSDAKGVHNFALSMSAVLMIFGVVLFLKKSGPSCLVFFFVSSIFAFLGMLCPKPLVPVYRLWMAFAAVIGWVMTRLLLTVLFYLVITPIGLLAKLCGNDFLSIKLDGKAGSYWVKRPPAQTGTERYEKQF